MGLPKCVTGRPMWRRTEPNQGPHLDPPDLTRGHTLCPQVSLSSHTHTYQHRHLITKFSSCLYPLPPCIYILKGISRHDVIFISLSRPLSFLVPSLPRAPTGPSIHASLEYVIHTNTSLGPAKCINYTITQDTSRTPLI